MEKLQWQLQNKNGGGCAVVPANRPDLREKSRHAALKKRAIFVLRPAGVGTSPSSQSLIQKRSVAGWSTPALCAACRLSRHVGVCWEGLSMHTAIRNDLNEDQSRTLTAACDLAWRRILATSLMTPIEQAYSQNILALHLLRLVRRGECDAERLARRGVFLICGLLACPDCVYTPGEPLRTDGADIVF